MTPAWSPICVIYLSRLELIDAVILSIHWYPYLRKKKKAADFQNFFNHSSKPFQNIEFSDIFLPYIALVIRLCTSLNTSHFVLALSILSGRLFPICRNPDLNAPLYHLLFIVSLIKNSGPSLKYLRSHVFLFMNFSTPMKFFPFQIFHHLYAQLAALSHQKSGTNMVPTSAANRAA
jgi:hypothetical protein